MNKRKSIVISLAVCAVWLAVWQTAHLLVYARMGSSLLLPSPLETLQRLGQLLGEPDFYSIVGHTVLRIFSGLLLGTAAGCLLGGLTAFSPLLHRFFALPMNAIKSTPVASFVILALVWIKGENLSTFIALLMVLPVIWQGVHTGLQSADPDLLEMAQVYRFSRGKKLRYLYLPAALPHLLSAMRVGLGFSWKSGIAGEVIAIPSQAIGTQLYHAKIYLDMPGLFAWTIVIILLSAAIERTVLLLLPDPNGGDCHA